MSPDGLLSLVDLADGASGAVVEVRGGKTGTARLDGMGIRVGARVTKVSGFSFRGPVTVRVGSSHVAVGHGMASRVIVAVRGG